MKNNMKPAVGTGECICNASAAETDRKTLGPVEFTAREIPCSVKPLIFDDSKCIGCNACARVCQVDVMVPSAEPGKHPEVLYPGECYYCGSCVMACPREGAIKLRHPIMNRTKFVEIK